MPSRNDAEWMRHPVKRPGPSSSQPLECRYRGEKPALTLALLYAPHARKLTKAAFFFVIKASGVWVMPVTLANVINILTTPNPHALTSFWLNAAVIALLLALNIPFHRLYVREMSLAMRDVEAALRAAIVRRLQTLSISFYKNSSSGVLQSKVLRDVEAVDQMSRQVFDGGLTTILALTTSLGITAWRAPQFLPIFLVTVALVSALRVLLQEKLRKYNGEFRAEVEGMSSSVTGMIDMIPVTRAHAVEEIEIDRVNRNLDQVKDAGLRLDGQNALFGSLAWFSFNTVNMVCLFLAGWLSFKKIIPLAAGDVVMLTGFFGTISNCVLQIANMLPTITKGFESVRSIGEVMESPDLESNLGKARLREVRGDFVFEAVSFIYKGATRVSIRDFSLHVEAGETLGIVGPSGAGKSTIVSLLLGFDRPLSGRILLDGRDLAEIDLRSFRQFVSVVTQETLLFEGTLRENILYGCRDIPAARLQQAIRDANAAEFIHELPDRLETRIGSRGARLSGGQRQRIAIARALIRDPRVLILDEATSSLDAAAEALVQEALERLMRGRTTFIIAHRLSTIRKAGRILALKDGRLVEIGAPGELLQSGGIYAQLSSLQQAAPASV